MEINIPGIDVKKGLELYDDDEEIYITVLTSYASNTPAVLDRIRNVTAENLPDYAITIHGVKGTSSLIGAEETRKTALQLEMLAKAGDLAGVLALNETFLKNTDTMVAGIQEWLKKNQ